MAEKGEVLHLIFPKSKDNPRSHRLVSFTLGKSQKQVLLEAISGHIEEKKVTGKTQHGFTKGKSCLTNLIICLDPWMMGEQWIGGFWHGPPQLAG